MAGVALVILVGWWWVGVASVMTQDMRLSCGWGGGLNKNLVKPWALQKQ